MKALDSAQAAASRPAACAPEGPRHGDGTSRAAYIVARPRCSPRYGMRTRHASYVNCRSTNTRSRQRIEDIFAVFDNPNVSTKFHVHNCKEAGVRRSRRNGRGFCGTFIATVFIFSRRKAAFSTTPMVCRQYGRTHAEQIVVNEGGAVGHGQLIVDI